MLKLALLPYFTMFEKTIYEFPAKKEPDPPSPWGRSWACEKHAAGLPVLGQRFFKETSKWRTKLTPVSQVEKVILGQHKLVSITAPFNNTRNLTFKSIPTVAFFAAVNHNLNICPLAINGP